MTQPREPAPAEGALEQRLRDAFSTAVGTTPPSPERLRSRLADLRSSTPSPRSNAFSSAGRLAGLAAGVAAIVVVAVLGSWSSPRTPPRVSAPALTSQGSLSITSPAVGPSQASGITDSLFLPGQTSSGDGWRLIAGRVGPDADPVSLAPRLTLYTDGGMAKPVEALHLPPVEAFADDRTEALLVVDLAISGGGPICSQIRLDGVAFDRDGRTMTVRYTPGWATQPIVCPADAIGATIVIAIARDHLPSGNVAASLVHHDPTKGDIVDAATTIVGIGTSAPAAKVPACTTSQLAITTTNSSAAAGTVGVYLRFVNRSNQACSMQGWPTVIGVTAGGATLTARNHHVGYLPFPDTPIQTVSLKPGDGAFSSVSGGDNPGPGASTCPPSYHTLRVTPPGNTDSVVLSAFDTWLGADLAACAGLWASPIVSAAQMNGYIVYPLRP